MPLEVRELLVKVNVGDSAPREPRAFDPVELAALKRELVKACLAELRQRTTERRER